MRCRSCDNPLSDSESIRKFLFLDEHIDMCTPCCRAAGILFKDDDPKPDGHDEWEGLELPDPFEEVLGG